MMADFLQRINSGQPLILDGGFGSLLESLGGSMKSCDNNMCQPELVARAHQLYIEAGSQAIISNTFALNGAYAVKQGMAKEKMERSLRSALEIAVQVSGGQCFLLGDLGPSGEMLPPLGQGDVEAIYQGYADQLRIMADYPLSAFLIETVFDLKEAEIILDACRETAPEMPVLLSMTFSSLKRGGCTLMGQTAAKIAKFAGRQDLAAVGANCGDLSPEEYAVIISSMKDNCDLPLLVQPNAGKPQLVNRQAVYSLNAEEFAAQMQFCYDAGARILGGCCGTTPEHISALAAAFK
jgi:5-methyltetrahydrofolate--homocysteine methyltransferase